MAEVTSSSDMTVIILSNEETEALASLLETSDPNDNEALDELFNCLMGWHPSLGPPKDERWTNKQVITIWKDQPHDGYIFGVG